MARHYRPKTCIDCHKTFTPLAGLQVRCKACQAVARAESNRLYNRRRREKQRAEREALQRKAVRKPRKKPIMTWPQIIKVCEDNHLSYGNAVAKGLIK